MALNKRQAVIVVAVATVIVAIGYQYMQPEKENPAVTFCRQQFMQTQNVSGEFACLTEAAVAQLDPAICVQVWELSTWMQSDCLKAVIAAAPEDPAVYEKLRNPWLRGMFQYQKLNLSSEEFNPTYGVDEYFRDIIRGEVKLPINVSGKHLFICNEIEDHTVGSQCYSIIAGIEKNASICDMIPIINLKDHCYRNIALLTHDPVFCDGVVDILLKTDCYQEAAAFRKDVSICDRIEIPSRREMCHQNAGA
jgi:hypothetical protein